MIYRVCNTYEFIALLQAAMLRTTLGSNYPSVGGPVSRLAHRPSFLPPKWGAYIIGIHHTYVTVSIFAVLNTGFWHSVHYLSRCRHPVSLCFFFFFMYVYSFSIQYPPVHLSVHVCSHVQHSVSSINQSQYQVSVSSIPYSASVNHLRYSVSSIQYPVPSI